MLGHRVAAAAIAVALAGVGALSAPPAFAHHKEGHSGGPGSNCDKPKDKAYPPGQCTNERASTSDSTLSPGQRFTFFAEGFEPGTTVSITLTPGATTLGKATPDGFAFFAQPLTAPMGAQLGPSLLTASGTADDGRALALNVPVRIIAASQATPGGTVVNGLRDDAAPSIAGVGLPRTGRDVALVALLGLALVAVGSGVAVAGRRRQHTATA